MIATATWQHGRQLVKTVKGLSTYSYTYDADGRRLTQTAPWIGKISYYYTGSELTKLTVQSHTLTFTYDNLGVESVDYDGTMYYYLRNAQGDITGIVDTSGNVVTEYVYDAWGNVISTTGSKSTTVGKYSPFRYRGYIYDDSGLYYLKTRYYDPAMGRFVCADGYASTGVGLLGTNSFAYCNNNPSTLKDSGGTRPVDCVRLDKEEHKKESIEATKKEVLRKKRREAAEKAIANNSSLSPAEVKSMADAYLWWYDDVKVGIDLDTRSFKITNSYLVCDYGTQKLICKLLCLTTQSDGSRCTSRTPGDFVAEWDIHNFATYGIVVARVVLDGKSEWIDAKLAKLYDQAKDADMEFDGDRRGYIYWPSRIAGIFLR